MTEVKTLTPGYTRQLEPTMVMLLQWMLAQGGITAYADASDHMKELRGTSKGIYGIMHGNDPLTVRTGEDREILELTNTARELLGGVDK